MNGQIGVLEYDRAPTRLTLLHTEVPAAVRGHRVGEALVKAALQAARAEGVRVIAVCPFVKAYLRKHREVNDGSTHVG